MYNSRMKDTRGFLAIVMALVMVFAGVAIVATDVSAGEAGSDGGEGSTGTSVPTWYDETKDSFVISTENELKEFADLVNAESVDFAGKTVKLGADIALTKDWTPIGTYSVTNKVFTGKAFSGTFDGNGKTISNLNITSTDKFVGFFGVTKGATIQNLNIENVDITGVSNVAAIVGGGCDNFCYIKNCHVSGDVEITGNYKVGGIIGGTYAIVEGCSVSSDTGLIKGAYSEPNLEGDNVGGIIGYLGESGSYRVTDCDVNIDISGVRKVGGIVGSTHTDRTISDCTYSGTLTYNSAGVPSDYSSTISVGGILGELRAYGNNFVFTGNNADNAVLPSGEGIETNKLIGFGHGDAKNLAESINGMATNGYYVGTYNGANALILEGYEGDGTFSDATGYQYVVVYGRNVITGADACVFSGSALTIIGGDDDAELQITASNLDMFVIEATGVITIEDLKLTVKGDNNRAIYGHGGVAIKDAIVEVDSAEKAIRAAGGVIDIDNSIVTATITGKKTNGQGQDDCIGLKAPKIMIDAGSTVTTEGIHIHGGTTGSEILGKLTVLADSKEGQVHENGTILFTAGLIMDKPVSIGEKTVITIDSGLGIVGEISNGENKVAFGVTNKPVYTSDMVTISYGSVKLEGDFVKQEGEDGTVVGITITGNVKISGTVDVPITVNQGSTVTVPKGETLVLNNDMTVVPVEGVSGPTTIDIQGTLEADTEADITVGTGVEVTNGKALIVNTSNPDSLKGVIDSTVTEVKKPTPKEVVSTVADIQKALETYQSVSISNPLTISKTQYLLIDEDDTLVLNKGAYIIIESDATSGSDQGLTVSGSIEGEGYILVYGYLALDSADVRVPVIQADEKAYISVTNPLTMSVTGDQNTDLGVGYGNTLELSGLTVYKGQSIDAWGTVVIGGDVTVESGAEFNVYAGGNAQIEGTLDVQGTVNVYGTMDIAGTVEVYKKEGGANVNVLLTDVERIDDIEGTVNVTGTMNVLKAGNNATGVNILRADDGKVVVEGTLTVTGTLSGTVDDMGTVVFNGASSDATIKVYDGVTLNVASVAGKLYISDDEIIDTEDLTGINYAISAGHKVELNNVKGVTVSVAVEETVKEVEISGDDVKYRFYSAVMTVSGSIVDTDTKDTLVAKVGVSNEGVSDIVGNITWPNTISKSTVTVGDVIVGEGVELALEATGITVDGTVSVLAKNSGITTTQTVDLAGTIIVGDSTNGITAADPLKVNGARYEIQTQEQNVVKETQYYTTFENAIAATGIYENKVDLYGQNKVESEVQVPAGIEVTMAVGSVLTIAVDGVLTVVETALLDGSDATIDVKGMLVIADKETGLEAPATANFKYQVKTETETSATYSGLILALKNAQAGDVIEVVGNAVIDESVTIPEGVTLAVPNKSALTVGDDKGEKVTLTVEGTLKVAGGTVSVIDTVKDQTEILIPGVVAINGTIESTATQVFEIDTESDYVKFEMKVDGKYVTVMSNLAYAAENATYGNVTVVGDITGGDVTFTKAEKGEAIAFSVPETATLVVGTLTLVGEGCTFDAYGDVTGTIASAAGSVDLVKASAITIAVSVETDVDGTTDIMTVTGTPVGSVAVATGTVTASNFVMSATKDNNMSVESGATLAINGISYIMGDSNVKAYVAIDGNVTVLEDKVANISFAQITGTVQVQAGAILNIGAESIVTGTVNVVQKTDDADAGIANVGGTLFVGTEPSIGASGTLVGTFTTTKLDADNVIVAYPGADLSGALIDVNASTGESDADSTEFYINGQLYMTAITADSVDVVTYMNGLGIDIPGLDTPKNSDGKADIEWYSDEAMKNKVEGSFDIGKYDKLYTEFDASEVKTVFSAGVGLQIYIDGLSADSFYDNEKKAYYLTVGTHTVSVETLSGYDGSNATITVNGVAVSNNGTFTIDVDDTEVVIIASGAVPAQSGTVVVDDADEGMSLTDILLIVLVILIVIMAIIVALRMMRS